VDAATPEFTSSHDTTLLRMNASKVRGQPARGLARSPSRARRSSSKETTAGLRLSARIRSRFGTGQTLGSVPAETTIGVYTDDGLTPLYSYTTTATNSRLVLSGQVNTGYVPFAQEPVYISYSPTGVGTTTFDF
jgi:hypothetical protein